MISRSALLRISGVALGSFGIVICLASMVILWIAYSRHITITDRLFDKMDASLTSVRERVTQIQERLAGAKNNTEELGAMLGDWTKQEAAQRLALRFNAVEKSQRISAALQQADGWLEVARSSVGRVQDFLSINDSTTVPTDTGLVDRLLEEITSLHGQIAEAADVVATIHNRLSEASDVESGDDQSIRATLALRVVAVLVSIDSRLASFADKTVTAQSNLQALKIGAQGWILGIVIGVSLIILLMAAGQIALCRLAWKQDARPTAE